VELIMTLVTSISKHTTQTIAEPLPPCWHRRNPTTDESIERVGGGLLSAGPQGSLGRALIDVVSAAKHTVLIASFLFSDPDLCNALLAAHSRGVRIYMLTASRARLTSQREDDFTAKMIEEHQRLLDLLAGKVVLRAADCFHAKFIVVDHASAARGWLSTANFNPALYRSRELGLELDRAAAQEVAQWFCWAFWSCAEHELTGEKGRLRAVDKPPTVPKVPSGARVLVTTPEHKPLRQRILAWIKASKRELWIASYGFDADHEVLAAIVERAKAGVPVTVLTRPRPANCTAVVALREAGARVLGHDKLHAKAIVCDHGALVMTANLDMHSLENSFEVGMVLDNQDHAALRETFVRWAESFPWTLTLRGSRSDTLGEIWLADQGKDTGTRRVVEQVKIRLGDVVALDALDLENAPAPKPERPSEHQQIPAAVRYEWVVRAPQLPKGAKRLDEDKQVDKHTPTAWQHKRDRYVLLEDEQAVVAARARAAELGARVVLP
jgi:cardiolipin synthase